MRHHAVTLAQDVLERPYNATSFARLANELVNKLALQGTTIPVDSKRFEGVVLSARLVGTAQLTDHKALHVLSVELPRRHSVERARTLQRDFVARYLRAYLADAALVAFYTRGEGSWRLSLVTLDVNLGLTEGGTINTTIVVSPAKRYSFLVGPDEKVRTAEQQLLPLLANSSSVPTLQAVEAAFSVEVVSKQFFKDYAGQYENIKAHIRTLLDESPAKLAAFRAAGIDVASFTKRLLGQIVFLYFLQKKGWLGVRGGERWGSGPSDFLRQLIDGDIIPFRNFFNDLLEPLLYEALALKEGSPLYREAGFSMPFLNGGLFEPYKGYDWRSQPLAIPNQAFKNLLDVFDRYNFTVREDHPLEQEVAVDPEMLGKVFEQLIEENERHEMGAHYTPREIVHYMTQEVLVRYLCDVFALERSKTEVEQQALFSASVPIQDSLQFSGMYLSEKRAREFILTDEPLVLAANKKDVPRLARAVDEALARVKVLDPAIGSGAFPLGLINELVRAREALTPYTDDQERTSYDLKWHAITQSIYGADLDQGAVDIAKLRMWLSLVVDEDPTSLTDVHPLPNLEYKIVQGNSVLSMPNALEGRLHGIQEAKARYTILTDPAEKRAMRDQISAALPTDPTMEFDFRAVFSEVFDGPRSGFDICIGNPPYVRHEEIAHLKPHLKANTNDEFGTYESYAGQADLFVYFIERGVKCLRQGGILSYIVSNKWLRSAYGEDLKKFLERSTHLLDLINFGELPVFENAVTYPMILTVKRGTPKKQLFRYAPLSHLDLSALRAIIDEDASDLKGDALDNGIWTLVSKEEGATLNRVWEGSVPMHAFIDEEVYYGVKTGRNEAFVVDEETRDRLIREDESSHELLKPYVGGTDIRQYVVRETGNYLILARRGIDIDSYPAIKRHLETFRSRLEPRPPGVPNKGWLGRKPGAYKWYELQDAIDYHELFEKPKIMFPDMAAGNRFALDTNGLYPTNTGYFVPSDDPYLLAVLNSPVTMFVMQCSAAVYRGGYYRWFEQYVERLPIPEHVNPELRLKIAENVRELHAVLAHVSTGVTDPNRRAHFEARAQELNQHVNLLVYEAFGLTQEAINLIESRTS